jgi:hypothetical protein
VSYLRALLPQAAAEDSAISSMSDEALLEAVRRELSQREAEK